MWVLKSRETFTVNVDEDDDSDSGGGNFSGGTGTYTVNIPDSGGGGPTTSPNTGPLDTVETRQYDVLVKELQLSVSQKFWLKGKNSLVGQIHDFLAAEVFSEEAKDFAKEAIAVMMDGYTTVGMAPFVKYPSGSNYATLYPRLTAYLRNELPKLADNAKIVNKINDLTDAPKDIIKDALKWGKGPEIRIEDLYGEKLGAYRGHLEQSLKHVLFLDLDLVNDFENAPDDSELSDSLGFLIAVTLLHEYNHLGDTVYGDEFWGNLFFEEWSDDTEVGLLFEDAIFGETVWRDNAGIILKKTEGF